MHYESPLVGDGQAVAVAAGHDEAVPSGRVRLAVVDAVGPTCGANTHTSPDEAREIAAALLRAADEAEGRTATDMTDEERTIRSAVAAELETLPRYNDMGDWCTNINRRQAIDTARHGRRV
jgi:hypothetical protein